MNDMIKKPVCPKIVPSYPKKLNNTKQNKEIMHKISRVVSKAAEGDFSARVIFAAEKSSAGKPETASDKPKSEELLQLAKSINSMMKKLEKQDINKKNAVSAISHDLKTPLTSMKGFVEGIIDGRITDDSIIRYLNIVNGEISKILLMINSIKAIYADSQSRAELNMTGFDINKLIYQVVAEMELLLDKKNIKVILKLTGEPDSGLLIIADKSAIERILYNLLDNAIQFVPQSGLIRISTIEDKNGNLAEIAVEDNGDGILQEDYRKIFKKSYRGRNSFMYEGQGLGLYICKELILAHNQEIWPDKSDLGGAKFTFTLSRE